MDTIINTYPAANRTFLFSLGFLLTFIVLLYFYIISINKDNADRKNKMGLLAMSIIFFFYVLMGITFIYSKGEGAQFETFRKYLFLLSGCINICFVLTIPFFSRGATSLDEWSKHRLWNYVVLFIGLLYASSLILDSTKLIYVDLPITAIVMIIIGVFISWDFERRDMKFVGYLIALLLMAKVMLQIFTPEIMDIGNKFDHVNMTIMFPAMIEAVVAITISFNWINGLRYKRLAKIYSSDKTDTDVQQFFDKKSTKDDLKKGWKNKIIKNDLEGAIQSMILFLEKRNEHFEIILSIASRNNRNNTGQMKGVLSSDEYNLTRNKIIESLLDLIGKI